MLHSMTDTRFLLIKVKPIFTIGQPTAQFYIIIQIFSWKIFGFLKNLFLKFFLIDTFFFVDDQFGCLNVSSFFCFFFYYCIKWEKCQILVLWKVMLTLIKWYMVHSISFQTSFIQAFKIVIDSWEFSMLLLYILWDDWPIFMISASNEQLQQQLEYTLLKSDCHSWWISKMQSGHEDTLEEWYAIKFCFKLGKNVTEMYGIL